MAGYVIVEIEVTDPVGYEEYKKLAGRDTGRRLAAQANRHSSIRKRGASQGMAELSRIPRTQKNAPSHGQDQDDRGGGFMRAGKSLRWTCEIGWRISSDEKPRLGDFHIGFGDRHEFAGAKRTS